MSREYREVERVERTLHVSKVICDRCGESARVIGAPPSMSAWGLARVLVQGDGDTPHEADLCRTCSEELREWIDSHPGRGRGMSSVPNRVEELNAAARRELERRMGPVEGLAE